MRTYKGDNMIQSLQPVGDVLEIKEHTKAAVQHPELVVELHQGRHGQKGSNDAAGIFQSVLVNAGPWRVSDAEKDGLLQVSRDPKLGQRAAGQVATRRAETYVVIVLGLVVGTGVAITAQKRLGRHVDLGEDCECKRKSRRGLGIEIDL